MRHLIVPIALCFACASKPPAEPIEPLDPQQVPPSKAEPVTTTKPEEAPQPKEVLAADTPKTTVAGNTFVAPAGWSLSVRGPATLVAPPEGDSTVALIDVQANDADEAMKLAWAAYSADKQWPVKLSTDVTDKDGWSKIRRYEYVTSPNEKRTVLGVARFANGTWNALIYDMTTATGEKRAGQVQLIIAQLLPKGFERENFAGKKANTLDKNRIAELGKFIENAEKLTGVPGVSIGLIQDNKVVFAGGFGVRELGKPAKVDADTRYIIASNTKAMTTLMLGKLVDEKKMTWETQATSLLPTFKLGDADTTSRVLVKHLICACTGLPRQDMEWLLEFKGQTPDSVLTTLGTMQPTSKFGELFQYSNPLAAAAGFIGGHVAYPKLELGKAYDDAMRTRVFEPLGMKDTTFDFKRAESGNAATPHAPDIDGKTTRAIHAVNSAVIPVRPAGGAWSNVKDVLKYVQMELAEGKLPNGKQYIAKETLFARRTPQVAIGKDTTYGMGLMVNTRYGVTVVNHGGDLVGFHSDMMWLPEHGVGAVVLTNGDPGWLIRTIFRRKLLEVLFDGHPEADADIAAAAKVWFDQIDAERKTLTVPADPAAAEALAAAYGSTALGDITVIRGAGKTTFDFGEWKSEMGSRKNPDGTTSFLTLVPGVQGLELVVGAGAPQRTLILRDNQHEYVFAEKSNASR